MMMAINMLVMMLMKIMMVMLIVIKIRIMMFSQSNSFNAMQMKIFLLQHMI